MKKEDILKVLEEANLASSNLTDKQIERYYYDYFTNKQKKQFKNFVKKGGKIVGELHHKSGTGLFARSKKKIIEDASNAGKIGGKRTAELGYVKKAGEISAKSPKHPNNILVKCTHCGKETTLPLNRRWHMDNCKHKK